MNSIDDIKSSYERELVIYYMDKGKSFAEAVKCAFATIVKHKQEGMPDPNKKGHKKSISWIN